MKKLNESQVRSPKWLRKYFDFEISTGKDVSPEAKARRKQIDDDELKAEIEKKAAIKRWNEQWDKVYNENLDYFKKFLKFKGLIASTYIDKSDLYAVKKSCEVNKYFSLIDEFEFWKKQQIQKENEESYRQYQRDLEERRKKEESERRQNQINNEVENIYQKIANDFRYNSYNDKFETRTINSNVIFTYKFEDGTKVSIDNEGKLNYGNTTYSLGMLAKSKFISLANEIISKAVNRPGNKHKGNAGSQNGQNKHFYSEYKETPKTENPTRNKYNLLNDKIKLREEQLKRMSYNDPNRAGLENELKSYKRVRDKMKADNKFESLILSFENFKG